MSDLPAALRLALAQEFSILTGTVAGKSDCGDGVTKLLIQWPDGLSVETVLIPADGRACACVSTQVGCGVECTFCASGQGGLKRNLTSGEIVEQILQLRLATGQVVTHVVFMGMGEPLANYDATVAAIHTIVDPDRLGISARRVTVSTVGLPKQIRKLAMENLPITLAISLHAPTEALRRKIMPKAPSSIAEIVAAAQEFFASRKREITLEYILLEGVNDTNVCAEALARIAAQLRCNVNLIRYNPVASATYRQPSQAAVKMFAQRLDRCGVNVQIRLSKGQDSDAACGQLRNRLSEQT
jgi:23S rRNA (adenine2503-C2)-methyltransferase